MQRIERLKCVWFLSFFHNIKATVFRFKMAHKRKSHLLKIKSKLFTFVTEFKNVVTQIIYLYFTNSSLNQVFDIRFS